MDADTEHLTLKTGTSAIAVGGAGYDKPTSKCL